MNLPLDVIPGDIVETAGAAGSRHFGFFAARDVHGREWILHNAKFDQVRFDIVDDFARDQAVTLYKRVGDWTMRQAVLERAKKMLGRRYDLLSFNCEHFVNYAVSGTPSSPQVAKYLFGTLLAVVVGAVIASDG